MKKINVGVIGSGFIIPIFIRVSRLYKEFHLKAIWGRHEDKLLNFKDDFDYYTCDLEAMLNDKDIDVIYVAIPNSLHYEYGMMALKHGKHVIMEKPFTVHYDDAKKLINYAKKHDLIIFEGITTLHNPFYHRAAGLLDSLGEIRLVECNYSQYSRRYDRFKKGVILPAFDRKLAGGALLDINVYNIHFVCGLFGKPKKVYYRPNVEKGIDTSGVVILDYGKFKASCTAAKDCWTESYAMVQGDAGYLRCNSTSSRCNSFSLRLNDGRQEDFEEEDGEFGGWKFEMKEFISIYKQMDLSRAQEYNRKTLTAVWVLEEALKSAGLKY